MNGVVFTGGEGPERADLESILEDAGLLVAADSGLLLCRSYGIDPHLIVGDFDSLPDPDLLGDYPHAEIIRYPRDKDATDTEIGLQMLVARGCHHKTLLGGGGGRLDHLFGILSTFHRRPCFDLWRSARSEVRVIHTNLTLNLPIGETLSLFPVGEERVTMKSNGLKWALDKLEWRVGDTGISNVVVDEPMSVTVTSGSLIMVRNGGATCLQGNSVPG